MTQVTVMLDGHAIIEGDAEIGDEHITLTADGAVALDRFGPTTAGSVSIRGVAEQVVLESATPGQTNDRGTLLVLRRDRKA